MVLRFAYHPSPPIFHLSKLRTNDSVGWKRCIDKSWQVCVVFDLITPSAISCLQGLNISQTSVRCCVQPINIVLQTARLNWWYLMSAFYFIHIGFETSEKELKRMNAVTTRIKKNWKEKKLLEKKPKRKQKKSIKKDFSGLGRKGNCWNLLAFFCHICWLTVQTFDYSYFKQLSTVWLADPSRLVRSGVKISLES